MSKYPLIQKYMSELVRVNFEWNFGTTFSNGKTIDKKEVSEFILASELESILAKGQILHGCKRNKQGKENWAWDNNYTDDTTTHTCLAIDIKPIESQEPVSKQKLIDTLKEIHAKSKLDHDVRVITSELWHLLEKNGVRND